MSLRMRDKQIYFLQICQGSAIPEHALGDPVTLGCLSGIDFRSLAARCEKPGKGGNHDIAIKVLP